MLHVPYRSCLVIVASLLIYCSVQPVNMLLSIFEFILRRNVLVFVIVAGVFLFVCLFVCFLYCLVLFSG
jgi:hypothetical protein